MKFSPLLGRVAVKSRVETVAAGKQATKNFFPLSFPDGIFHEWYVK